MHAADAPEALPVERLRGLIAALLAAYEGVDALHKVQINELSALPVPRQQELKAYLWFRPGGPMSRAAYANLVTQIMVDGIARLGTDSPTRFRLRSKVTSL